MLVKKEKLMAQTTTKHRLGLFHGPFDSFLGVDGVGSGAIVRDCRGLRVRAGRVRVRV